MRMNWSLLFCILISIVLGSFVFGFQSTPYASWCFFCLFIHILRQLKKWYWKISIALPLIIFSSFIGTYSLFEGISATKSVSIFVTFSICVALVTIPTISSTLVDHFVTGFYKDLSQKSSIARIVSFPAMWTFTWFLVTLISPTGTYGLWSFSQSGTSLGRLLVSVVGPYGVEFCIAAFGCFMSDLYEFSLSPSSSRKKIPFMFSLPFFIFTGFIFFATIWELFSQREIFGQPIWDVPNASGIGALHVTCASQSTDEAFTIVREEIKSRSAFNEDKLLANWKHNNERAGLSVESDIPTYLLPVNLILFSEGQGSEDLYSQAADIVHDDGGFSRTIVMMTSATKGNTADKEDGYRNEAVLFAPWKSSTRHESIDQHLIDLSTSMNLASMPLLSERKRHGVPIVEKVKDSTPAGGHVHIPQDFKLLGDTLSMTICFDLDNQDSWRSFGGLSFRKTLLLNPAGTWGSLGFRRYHANRQRFIADAMGISLIRCVRDGESTTHIPFGVGGAAGLSAAGEIWSSTVEQPMSRISGGTFYGIILMHWYGDIVILGLMLIGVLVMTVTVKKRRMKIDGLLTDVEYREQSIEY